MKKLIVAICTIVVAITATAQYYNTVNVWGFQVYLEFNDNSSTIIGVHQYTSFVEVRSKMKAEKVFRNLDNISKIEVCSCPFGSEEKTYDYRADNMTDAVRLLIKAIKAN